MAITFEFVQDFRKYREYITYVTKVDEALGRLPFTFYQGDMLSCFVVEKKGDTVTVTLSNNTDDIKDRFIKDAQPNTFESIPEGIAYMYDLDRHELIYNYDAREPSSLWNWSTYPETFWIPEDDKYDHGLILGSDGKLCRLYLSNKKLVSLFVGLDQLNTSFPNPYIAGKPEKVTLEPAGVNAALSIIACQLGQDEPRLNDVKTAMSCDLVNPVNRDYAKYNFEQVIKMFELKGNEDDLWEDTWGASLDGAIERDNEKDARRMTIGATAASQNAATQGSYTNQLLMSELADLSVVPESDRPIYVHMDIPIHGIHYMMIEPDQTLAVFFDDLIIREEDILQHFENLPQDQIAMHGDYVDIEDTRQTLADAFDELNDLDASGTISTNEVSLDDEYKADSDQELGLSGGRH